MTLFLFLSFGLECLDIVLDALFLSEVTGPTFQPVLFCHRWVYKLMAVFLFTGLAKLGITIVLSTIVSSNICKNSKYEVKEFRLREIHVVFSFIFEGKGFIN